MGKIYTKGAFPPFLVIQDHALNGFQLGCTLCHQVSFTDSRELGLTPGVGAGEVCNTASSAEMRNKHPNPTAFFSFSPLQSRTKF